MEVPLIKGKYDQARRQKAVSADHVICSGTLASEYLLLLRLQTATCQTLAVLRERGRPGGVPAQTNPSSQRWSIVTGIIGLLLKLINNAIRSFRGERVKALVVDGK